ncbi:histidine phosphotransferase family protein [Histidinibacterium aquaticum]|uniref:Histidine phosphotransferase n=1 Tax=Histidinibacterium aquaticum TaxID=2613962 RepID=A0A5J5GLI1_9RHOB|nr:histidine phosphotransferase family protein [Histidinibacterium aquaticum]KAA9008887.1 histidine phosphotransferase [Histidinibacterium aquaticum]
MDDRQLSAMVASRICHDLISPIGAISNGLELMSLSTDPGDEVDLVSRSVANAQARIRFFRLAFGNAPAEQALPSGEVAALLDEMTAEARTGFDWRVTGRQPRPEVRAALLAMLCCETALPTGGTVRVVPDGDRWWIEGRGPRIDSAPEPWEMLEGTPAVVTPATVQFALLPQALEDIGSDARVQVSERAIAISF